MQIGAEMKETNIQNEIMIALSKAGATIFRNNVGVGWAGKAEKHNKSIIIEVHPCDVVVRNARPLRAGLCVGSADLIGWVPVVITQEMVGTTVAVFLAPEIKTKTGASSDAQVRFINAVNNSGGRAGIARNSSDAVQIALAKVTGKS
jgi:hypothetical protein